MKHHQQRVSREQQKIDQRVDYLGTVDLHINIASWRHQERLRKSGLARSVLAI